MTDPRAQATRWRAFADVVAIALGVNVWVSVVLVPGLFVGAWGTPSLAVLALTPLPVLGAGLWRRSEAILLLAFPSALLVPAAVRPEIVSTHVYGPLRFSIVAIGLLAYVLGVSFFTSFHEPTTPVSVRPLSSSKHPTPQRWLRRFRMYRLLAILAIVFPAALLWKVNFSSTTSQLLRESYPGKVAIMTALLNIGAIVAWLFIYVSVFMGALKPHRTGDRGLTLQLAELRAHGRRGRPGPLFYVGVALAIGLMILLLILRS